MPGKMERAAVHSWVAGEAGGVFLVLPDPRQTIGLGRVHIVLKKGAAAAPAVRIYFALIGMALDCRTLDLRLVFKRGRPLLLLPTFGPRCLNRTSTTIPDFEA